MTPITMKAAVVVESGKVAVQEVPVPVPGNGQVLVKVLAAAQNPVDWKLVCTGLSKPGSYVGCDFMGIVEATGPDAVLQPGEKVAGFVLGYASRGSFAEYVLSSGELLIPLPANATPEDNAGLALCAFTAFQVLHQSLGVDVFAPPPETPRTLLVWSGATAVGQAVIQLAKLLGFRVIATASPESWELVRALGADEVLDYHDVNVADKIRELTENSLEYIADCYSEGDSQAHLVECLGSRGGTIATILKYKDDMPRADTVDKLSLVFTLLGKPVCVPIWNIPPILEHHANAVRYAQEISRLVKAGLFHGPVPRVLPGGLESIQEGLETVRAGGVRRVKLIHVL